MRSSTWDCSDYAAGIAVRTRAPAAAFGIKMSAAIPRPSARRASRPALSFVRFSTVAGSVRGNSRDVKAVT